MLLALKPKQRHWFNCVLNYTEEMREALSVYWPSYKYHLDFYITFYAKSAIMDTWFKTVLLDLASVKNLQNKNWKWWGSFCKKIKKLIRVLVKILSVLTLKTGVSKKGWRRHFLTAINHKKNSAAVFKSVQWVLTKSRVSLLPYHCEKQRGSVDLVLKVSGRWQTRRQGEELVISLCKLKILPFTLNFIVYSAFFSLLPNTLAFHSVSNW